MEKRLIINADDFGLCEGVNKAIERSHKKGVLSSATMMAGMAGTQEAVDMARDMPGLGVGVHLNLVEGPATCQNGQTQCLLDENGEFKYSPGKIAKKSLLSGAVREAIEVELSAQIESLLKLGLKPTHFDSHKHVHTFPMVYKIVVKLARKYGIDAIRRPLEGAKTSSSDWPLPSKNGKTNAMIISAMARVNSVQNRDFIKNDAFYGIAHTGKADIDFWMAVCKNARPGVGEVMVHPGYVQGLDPKKTRLIEQRVIELDALCSGKTKACIEDAGIEIVNYGDIK